MKASLAVAGLLLAGSTAVAQNNGPVPFWRRDYVSPPTQQAAPAPAPTPARMPTVPAPRALTPPPGDGAPRTTLHFVKESFPVAPAAELAAPRMIPGAVQPTAFQPAPLRGGPSGDEQLSYNVQLTPPGPQRVFRLESEAALFERIRQEALDRPTPERVEFPTDYKPLADGPYEGRQFPPTQVLVEPAYVCHRRLFFEEVNSERYGWELGVFQPLVSTGHFFWDVATLPYHVGTEPCRHYDCSSGKCLPGDPVPYLLYPPDINYTGSLVQIGVTVALFAIFP